jgi:large subunit ribosomal protein L22
MEVRAVSKYARISPQKVRKLVGAVKGMPVEDGLDVLKYSPQKAAGLVEQIVRSAVANAEQQDMDVDDLIISNIVADHGPMLKRWRPRARGRATRILKRTSHITVTLSDMSYDD